jgi:tRNA (cytidine/uridine-2'-O-)-methyltransferase
LHYEPFLHIVLHQPEIPPNTGNIGRTCVAIGAKLWLVEPLGFDVDEKARRRAGLDYWERLEWEVVPDWASLVERLAAPFAAKRSWFFSAKAKHHYAEVEYQPGDVLVFGRETKGLPAEILSQHPDRTVTIPCRSAVRSLNLSVAAGAAALEAVRQIELRGNVRPR